MYFCKICSKKQTSLQPRYREISCNACLVFFQRTIYLESMLKCKNNNNSCANGPPKQILRCRKCRYAKCIKVGMPAPIIRPFGTNKIPFETAAIYAYTIDTLLLTAALHPSLVIPYLKKENQTIFDISFQVAKNCYSTNATIQPPKIHCLTNLLQNSLIDVKNELEYLCFICVCKFNFKAHLSNPDQQEEMQKLQNNGFKNLENDKLNVSILFEWIKISKQSLYIIEFFSFL